MTDPQPDSDRRTLLKQLGAATAAITSTSIAGCLYTPAPSGGPAGGDNGNGGPGQRPQTGPRTEGAFLYESFENGADNAIQHPDNPGKYMPDHPDALRIDNSFSRTGRHSMRLAIDYNWNYPVRKGSNKPIPDNRSTMQDQGYSTWGEPIWFAFSLGLDPNWQPDSIVEQVHEFHRDLSENPGADNENWDRVGDATGADLGAGKPLTTQIDGRTLQFRNGWIANGDLHDEYYEAPVTLQAGTWYDIVMNIKWTNENNGDGTGFLRIWVNGHLVVDHQGNTAANDVAPPRPPELRIYKWLWESKSPDTTRRSYLFDEIRYGWGNATYQDMVPGARGGTVASYYPHWWTT